MKKLIVLLVLSSCVTTSTSLRPDIKDYCGEVGPLSVYADRNNGFIVCADAMLVTYMAYTLLQQKAGPLKEPWDVEYTYRNFSMDAVAITYPIEHIIKVKEGRPNSVFHELLHAYLQETTPGKHDDHKKICTNHIWFKAEADFDEWPIYCYTTWRN